MPSRESDRLQAVHYSHVHYICCIASTAYHATPACRTCAPFEYSKNEIIVPDFASSYICMYAQQPARTDMGSNARRHYCGQYSAKSQREQEQGCWA